MLSAAGSMLEPRELVFASDNPHKLREISRLFPGFRVLAPRELGIRFSYAEEGRSYLENALGKAYALLDKSPAGKAVLADDSGLSVSALNGEPGIHSARYGAAERGRKLTDLERIQVLLSRMEGVERRACRFICCMVMVLEQERFVIVQEAVSGQLALEPAGSGGFGYDPVFYLPELGRTCAQLSDEEKDRISHRGKAARRLLALLGLA